ncbi:bacterioferritin-associated ferredoxin [Isoalcanivorax pacificus W11-5]|uniref:Bacterioferritin-associated ferredoxin n=2 Tax=Oceanospirillales TaxID=135619 RepID=A0A0B4XMQ2_9GAMM|nr:bacterioferritin-associated ferredoxin [Isoalcanivorax pacificus W11-5]
MIIVIITPTIPNIGTQREKHQMYVCLCKGITDGQIREAVDQGCDSLRDLRRELGVASQCGKCARQARGVIREARTESSAPVYAAATSAQPVMFIPQPA